MDKKELKTALSKARKHREYGQFAECLAILHQVVAEYPEARYYYLLASAYYESGSGDAAQEYANQALETDPQYKEAWELKGIILEEAGKLKEAEQMYLKSLEIDYDYYEARNRLIRLYFYTEKRYEDTIEQCEYVFSYKKFDLTDKNNFKNTLQWFYALCTPLYSSYIYMNRYRDAIKVIDQLKGITDFISNGNQEYTLSDEDEILYKLYYLLKDKEGLEKIHFLWKNYYKVSDSYISGMEKDAQQGYILSSNNENYDIDKDGVIY